MELWYFAYGSNLSCEQLTDRIGSSAYLGQPPRVARLADYRLVFQRVTHGGPAFANICNSGDGVIGVIYRFCPADFKMLDRYEQGYQRQAIKVTDMNGEKLSAVAYVMRADTAASIGRPTADYLQRIVQGAKSHGLPETYITELLAIAAGESG